MLRCQFFSNGSLECKYNQSKFQYTFSIKNYDTNYKLYITFWGGGGLCHAFCGLLVSRSGIEPRPRQWDPRILTTRPPGNSTVQFLKVEFISLCFRFGFVSCLKSLFLLLDYEDIFLCYWFCPSQVFNFRSWFLYEVGVQFFFLFVCFIFLQIPNCPSTIKEGFFPSDTS